MQPGTCPACGMPLILVEFKDERTHHARELKEARLLLRWYHIALVIFSVLVLALFVLLRFAPAH